MADSVQPAADRLPFLDGLRGIASLMVCVVHTASYGLIRSQHSSLTPWLLAETLEFGTFGVQIFFVLSGFVICYSQRHATITAKHVAKFAVRRSLRLDPPYWAAIALAIAIPATWAAVFDNPIKLPSPAQVAAHVCYLQGILGFEHIDAVYWTLCIEVQFYLVLMLLLAVSQRSGLPLGCVSLPLLVLSVVTLQTPSKEFSGPLPVNSYVSALPHYALFYLGSTICEAFVRRGGYGWFWLGAAAAAGRLAVNWNNELAAGVVSALIIYAACRTGGIRTRLAGPIVQFLGRISYSLYLFHSPIVCHVVIAGRRIFPHHLAGYVAGALLAIACAIIGAAVMYQLIERPSVTLSRRAFRATAPTAR